MGPGSGGAGPAVRRLVAAALAGALVLGVELLFNPHRLGSPGVWAPAAAGAAAVLLALLGLGRLEPASSNASSGVPVSGSETLLSFGAMPAGGIQAREEGLRRLDEELALALDYGRPLGLVMLGLDASTGSRDLEDQMIGLEEVAFGAMRNNDIVFKSGPTELVLLLPETATEATRGVVKRIQSRSSQLGTVRAVLAWSDGAETAAAALEELESGLELCRLSGRLTADPFHLLV